MTKKWKRHKYEPPRTVPGRLHAEIRFAQRLENWKFCNMLFLLDYFWQK